MPGTMYLRRITRADDKRPARYEAIYQDQWGSPSGRQYAREFATAEELNFFLAEKMHINHEAVKTAVTEMVESGASELKDLTLPSIDLVGEHMVSIHGQY